jgi:hypothetical protein
MVVCSLGPPPTPDHTVDHEDGNPSNNATASYDQKKTTGNQKPFVKKPSTWRDPHHRGR